MKKAHVVLLAGSLTLATSCKDFLDVNTNPNAPETVAPNLYLAPMLHWMATSPQFDGRFIARYTQQWTLPNNPLTTWDRMGYDPGNDNGGQVWRDVYWNHGKNLVDMMAKSEAEQRWDLLGIGYVLKAWDWHALTGLHGEIIIKEAYDTTKYTFNYDSQEFAYQETQRLLSEAIANLARTDGFIDPLYVERGDKIYRGNRSKWTKFANGLLAMTLNHYTNKSVYDPAAVIAAVDKSFTGNVDDALWTYPGLSADNADFNFWGRTRGNVHNFRQTLFILRLMDGTHFGAVDPRMSRMLSPAPDGAYRGLDPNLTGFGTITVLAQQPNNFHGYPGNGGAQLPGRYLFDDKAKMPIMTYSQLQFIKAEAAFRMGNRTLALDAYTKGISSHIDFVNARNQDNNQTPTQITADQKAAFLADVRVVPTAANLTLTHIMSQKYIAQWAWGHGELWMDMRRYHYTDMAPTGGRQVYPGFAIPTNLYPDNVGKPVQRLRPRYNSEYIWNRPGLEAIGGLVLDYHTKPLWITLP